MCAAKTLNEYQHKLADTSSRSVVSSMAVTIPSIVDDVPTDSSTVNVKHATV